MNFEEIYQKGENLYRKGKIEEAISYLEKTLEGTLQKDARIELFYLLGKCKGAASKGEEAISAIRKGLEIAEKSSKKELQEKGTLYLEKISGEISLHQGRSQEGSEAYGRARKVAEKMGFWEEEIDLILRESKALFSMGEDHMAREMLEQAEKKTRKKKDSKFLPTILGDLGDIALRDGNSEKAQKYYEKSLEQAVQNKDNLGIVESYSRLGKWHFYTGNTDQALELLEKSVKLARKEDNIQGQIDALGTLGKIYFFIGENEKAKQSYQQALTLAKKISDFLGELNNLGNLGNVFLRLGQMDDTQEHFKEALGIARQIGDAQGEMNALGWLGDVFYQRGKNINALNHYYKALELAKRLGSTLGESSNLSRIGDIYFSRYENDTAFQKYSEALELARKANSPPAILNNLISLGDIYFRKGEDDQAFRHYEEALEIAYQLNSPQGMLNAIQSLGDVLLRRGREHEALHRFRQSLGLSRKLEDPVAEILSLRGIGDVFFRQGDYKKASAHFKKALEIARSLRDSLEELIQQTRIGDVYLKRGKRDLARKYFTEAYELARKYDSPEGLLTTLLTLGNFDVEQGLLEEGEKKFQEATHLAERLDQPLSKVKALAVIGWIGIQQGKFAEALKTYQETVTLLTPIASGDIEEELAPPTPSRKERLQRLKEKVSQAAQQDFFEAPLGTVQNSLPVDEETGEFKIPLQKDLTEETTTYGITLEDPLKEREERAKKEIVPNFSQEEGRQLCRKGWKALDQSLFGPEIPEILHSVIALGKIQERRVLPLLERAYGAHQKENELLNQIIKALEVLPGKESGPTLSRLFREEKKGDLKISLAEVLASQGHLGGVDYLLTLSHKKGPFQKRAIEALGNSGQKEIIPTLQEILEKSKGDDRLTTTILTALMALGVDGAEDQLMDSLNSSDLTNMFFTAKALARAGKSSAVHSLETITQAIIDKKKPSLEEFSILQRAVEERLSAGGNLLTFLKKVFDFKPIHNSLFLMLDHNSAYVLKEELEASLKSQERWEIRASAAHALGYTDEGSLLPLKRAFASDSSGPVRVASAGSLIRVFKKIGLEE